MNITLYNTATRRKEVLDPIDPDNVRMYVCGPTVYDRAHLGNARPVLVFDVLYRLLRHTYGAERVTYVRNFTDVDDKINARAALSGRSITDITAETTQWFLDDMAAIGALQPSIRGRDHERAMPRATAYVGQMIAMISGLIADGYAYENEGHVLFRVRKYEDYGALSGRSVDDMIAGARVEVAPYKEDPMDFVMWKPSDDETPGWDSPWGRGRPGWHIECSAMAADLLGDSFDIHGGGNDLTFPHHENELAQSKCSCGGEFARHWFHSTHLLVNGKKMSKSSGTLYTLSDLADEGWSPMEVRYVLIGANYRKQLNFTMESLHAAREALGRLAKAAKDHAVPGYRELSKGGGLGVFAGAFKRLNEDLNMAAALGELFANLKNTRSLEDWRGFFTVLASLGLTLPEPKGIVIPEKIAKLAECRWKARQNKDWAASDRYRDELAENGWSVKDGREGYEVLPL